MPGKQRIVSYCGCILIGIIRLHKGHPVLRRKRPQCILKRTASGLHYLARSAVVDNQNLPAGIIRWIIGRHDGIRYRHGG